MQAIAQSFSQWMTGRHCGVSQSRRFNRRCVSALAPAIEHLEDRTLLSAPTVVDSNLAVREAASGLVTPVSMAFLGQEEDGFFVLEKNTGRVKHVIPGATTTTVLDLAVNAASERGLLGITLSPNFPDDPGVYLYWTESTTGSNTTVSSETPLLGNRVDRFVWDGSSLTFDENIIRLRAWQPANPPHETREFGNHDGGVLRFGPDGKLYIFIGDVGRRGQMQNLANGPFGPGEPDDQFGGPEPDDAHLTGVILRLNEDGTAPDDNPFFDAGAAIGGEVGANVQKIFSYGHRNSFGMDFDPISGDLWIQENGDDTFDEINRVEPGMNGGWVQFMGPVNRISEFKAIETDDTTVDAVTGRNYFGLQQRRWSPENTADTPEEALSRLFELEGSHYSDPEFSWKFALSPGGLAFLNSRALGPQYAGDLFVGAARTFLEDGYLLRMKVTGNRQQIAVDDPALEDRVADNNHKYDVAESESLLFGNGFGVGTDVQTGPNGNLYVVSLTGGAVYEIHRVHPGQGPNSEKGRQTEMSSSRVSPASHSSQNDAKNFVAQLSGSEEVPAVDTNATGVAKFQLSDDGTELHYKLNVANIENVTQAHIHLAPSGTNGPAVVFLFGFVPGGVTVSGTLAEGVITEEDISEHGGFDGTMEALLQRMRSGETYVNVHTVDHPAGEIRGQIDASGPNAGPHASGGQSATASNASSTADEESPSRQNARLYASQSSNGRHSAVSNNQSDNEADDSGPEETPAATSSQTAQNDNEESVAIDAGTLNEVLGQLLGIG